ncbi:DUF3307 domain-containing protein [Flavobacterium sp.]|uniref:DUF3307 domain-containing protein n=1 Tax=Flavobacterium sp. TaxID=239 RepID=UPI00286EA7C2|nr:DUF3307 domain-containing protein [Flavobacterium sp.]
MIVFVKLLLAHLLGDFILQPTSWVLDKEIKKHKSIYLYIHTILHGLLAWILVFEIAFGWYALLLALSHGAIDFLKLYFQKTSTKRMWFVVDQVLHSIVIVLIVSVYKNLTIDFEVFTNGFWIVITAILFLTKPASIIIKNAISVWTPENASGENTSLQNAGNYIGILERLLIFCFLITSHFEAIGFLLAAKSIFRFGDLKEATDRKLTEYVLIGTLLSFGIALLIGLLVQFLT